MSRSNTMRASLQRRDRSSRLKERTPLTISTVRTFSSSNSIKLTNVELTSESTTVENDSPQMCSQDCNLVVRRGSNLLLHLTLSQPLTSSLYTISLTFIPVYGPRERSSIFRASGKGKRKIELWLSVPLPANFPVGKYDTHVSLSLQSHVEILTHTVHSAVVVLFNPWHHNDDTHLDDPQDRQEFLISEVGIIWRGTLSSPVPLLWEYGQYQEYCLDTALLLLGNLSANDRRSASTVSRGLLSMVSPVDKSGVITASYNGRYGSGTHPSRWNGSSTIIQKYYRTRSSVKFGHCWVLAGVAITLLRALGIPCRPVTCYEAAQQCKQLGQVNCYFSPEGDVLDDLQTDEVWPYHIWCEAWMRRDDLPSGYDGWQALACGHSGTIPTLGPAPVKALLEKKRSKIWQYDIAHFLSELYSDLHYHRVTHSYSSFSQRALTLAHTHTKHMAPLLLTSSGLDCANYIDLTGTYKMKEEEEINLSHNGYPPPSQDCKFSVLCVGRGIDEDCNLTITTTNQGAMLRTVDGRVVGAVCSHNGAMVTKFTAIEFSGVITPGQAAKVDVPIQSSKFLRHLTDENMIKFFVIIKVRETRQLYVDITHHQVTAPLLTLNCPDTVRVGEPVKLKMSFTNPMPFSISHSVFSVQAQGLCSHKEVAHRQVVLPRRSVSIEVLLKASIPGDYVILANMHCDQLTNVRGWSTIKVVS